ncbi:MAG: rhomboid family intramembrane serine protease [Verrucomicrobiaceae bacterium]|nr:MAG: rhomboid family intramembrane serine protease [Verrucomicrobiaceae bacterium]
MRRIEDVPAVHSYTAVLSNGNSGCAVVRSEDHRFSAEWFGGIIIDQQAMPSFDAFEGLPSRRKPLLTDRDKGRSWRTKTMDEEKPTPPEEEWVKVGHYPNLRDAYDHGLVILAMGEACRVQEAGSPGEYDLQAAAHPAGKIHHELEAYGQESAARRPAPPMAESPVYPPGYWITGLWVLLVVAVFILQASDPSLVDRGASSAVALLRDGEWWRPFTALFLHADLSHLAGNLAGGAVFGTLVSRAVGALRAWPLILLCGALGNGITARIVYPESFSSIGASTAVFAALGILSGLGLSETFRERATLPWMRILAPVLAGLVLLGWLGSGSPGSNTDVLGHVCGFGTGVAGGLASSLNRSFQANA